MKGQSCKHPEVPSHRPLSLPLPFQGDVLGTSPRIQSPVTRPRGSWHLVGSPSQEP